MMNTQMNPGGLTDDELLRLARLLQQTRGEGLAFINQGEAQMLREAGGSGQPIPGTQGFGVGGGPIRSYQDPALDPDYNPVGSEQGVDDRSESEKAFDAAVEGYDYVTGRPLNDSGSDSGGGGQEEKETVITKFKDQFGNEYNTQAEADTANRNINLQKDQFKQYVSKNIKSDTDYKTFLTQISQQGRLTPEVSFEEYSKRPGVSTDPTGALMSPDQVKDKYFAEIRSGNIKMVPETQSQRSQYGLLPDEELEKIFNEQRLLTLEKSRVEVQQFTDQITQKLPSITQQDLQTLTYDEFKGQIADNYTTLSDNTKRTIFQTMVNNALRTQRFTLTPEEVAAFARDAIQVDDSGVTDATSPIIDTVDDAVAPKVGDIDTVTAPTIDTLDEAVAPTITTPDKATAPTISDFDEAQDVDVDALTAPDRTIIEDVGNINQEFLKQVRDGENELAEILKNRISGEARSPAEQQLRQATENNLRTLLSTTAGVIDPAKLRQVRNLYSETAQQLSGQAAELRSREQIDAENRLVSLYEQQGTRELQIAMADLENDRQIAIEQGRLDQARKLTILEADLQRIITKATLKQGIEIANLRERAATARAQGEIDLAVELENQATARAIAIAQGQIDADTEIANLRERAANARAQGQIDLAVALENSANRRAEVIAQQEADTQVEIANLNAAKDVAIAQGRIDVAIAIANLEKDVTLATTNADLALRSRALDDALALANFEGEMALEGIETKVELAELELDVKAELAKLGYETQEKIANLNADTQILIANLNKQAARYAQDSAERAGVIGAIGTIIAAAVAA